MTRPHNLALLAILSAGCGGSGTAIVIEGATETEDTVEVIGGETGNTDDTSATEETGGTETGTTTTLPEEPNASFELEEEIEGASLTLTWVEFGEEELNVGDAIASESADATLVEFYLPAPASDELIPVDPNSSLAFAFYAPALHIDSDEDGVVDDGETILGVGMQWLLYSNMEVPDWGLEFGWNSIILGEEMPRSPFEVPVEQNMLPDNKIKFGGELDVENEDLKWRAALVSWNAINGLPVADMLDDTKAESDWEIEVEEAPPADHIVQGQNMGADLSFEMIVGYVDENENKQLDGEDTWGASACYDGHDVFALHVGEPDGLVAAISFALQELTPGWYLMESWTTRGGGEQSRLLDPDFYGELELTDSCD